MLRYIFIFILMIFSPLAYAYSEAEGIDLYKRGFYPEAIEHWEQAATRGDAGAAYRLAEAYIDATIIERDFRRALKYLNIAASADEPRALTELAAIYDFGTGVRSDRKKAGQYYLRAAKLGMPAAMFNVASMLETGETMPQDKIEAYKYYLLSRDLGFAPFATAALASLARRMSTDDVAEAELRADNFLPGIE